MNKAVFLDRDGTINVEKHYLYRIEEFEFLPGVIEGLKLLQNSGYLLVIISNQSGIARGYYTEKDLLLLNKWMIDLLNNQGIDISAFYYCPHHPKAKIVKYRKECTCRKPALGLYEKAIKDLDIDVKSSWAIGDKIRDCSICEVMGCRGILIENNESNEVINQVKAGEFKRLEYMPDLLAASKRIVEGIS